MVSIYCLVDPRNNKPFYVGATEKPKTRLNGHLSRAKIYLERAIHIRDTGGLAWFPELQRILTVGEILGAGLKPKIHVIYECSKYSAQFYEVFFYHVLTAQGFELQQEIAKRYKSHKYEHQNRAKRKYLPLRNNLILIR